VDRSCIILQDINSQYHDLNLEVRLMRRQTLVFITEVGYLKKQQRIHYISNILPDSQFRVLCVPLKMKKVFIPLSQIFSFRAVEKLRPQNQ
jgi:hypothetical protein